MCFHGDSQSGFDDFMRLSISVHIYSCRLEAGVVLEDSVEKKGVKPYISHSLQVNPHFIIAAQLARGRLKTTCFSAGS